MDCLKTAFADPAASKGYCKHNLLPAWPFLLPPGFDKYICRPPSHAQDDIEVRKAGAFEKVEFLFLILSLRLLLNPKPRNVRYRIGC